MVGGVSCSSFKLMYKLDLLHLLELSFSCHMLLLAAGDWGVNGTTPFGFIRNQTVMCARSVCNCILLALQ